jgi:signal transduction histidine kinase
VPEHPPADDAVERQDPDPDEHAQSADDGPRLAGVRAERVHGVRFGVPPDDELREQCGEPDQTDGSEVDDQEGGTAVVRGLERELPDVPEADCASDRGEDESRATAPRLALTHACLRTLPLPEPKRDVRFFQFQTFRTRRNSLFLTGIARTLCQSAITIIRGHDQNNTMIDTVLPLVYAGTAVVTGSLAVKTWRDRSATGSTAMVGVLAAITGWLASIVAANLTTTRSPMLVLAGVALAGLSLTVAFLFVFSLRYAGYDNLLTGRHALVLLVHPLAVGFVALTNDGTGISLLGVGDHHLMYAAVDMGTAANGTIEWGVGFWVHTAYSYVLVLASTILILRTTLSSNDTYRYQSATVVFAIFIPWISNVLDLFVGSVDNLFALGFGASAVLLTVSIQRYELSTVAPVTRRDVMEAVADGVLVVDADGRIVDANDRARFLLGLEDALGADAGRVLPTAFEEFADPETAPTRERVHHHGRTFDVETTPFGDGDDGGRVFVVRDVTEQHAYRRELERKTERLDRFASVVSHDLRNPLSVANGYADIAEQTGDQDAFDRIHDAHDRMEALIEDVLLMAREGELSTDPEPVGLADLAERAWSTVETPNTTLAVHDDDDVAIEADPDRTVQLFENLFRNSVEHGSTSNRPQAGASVGDDDGEVAVTVDALEDGFAVADDGPGIDPGVREDLFETGVTGDDGTGLGLAIVDRISDAHGWRVDATDAADGGARFEVRGVDRAPDADLGSDDPSPISDDPLSS